MTIGTKSVLYGAHAFWLHPWFVALGWWKLYGFPFDPRLWACFFLHDIGYIGKPNMDGPEGESHPIVGAVIIEQLFGKYWGDFCRFHSRFYAKTMNSRFSKLCVADKMATVLTPSWLYLPMVSMTGELAEYMAVEREAKYYLQTHDHSSSHAWHQSIKTYLRGWIEEHRNADCDDSYLN